MGGGEGVFGRCGGGCALQNLGAFRSAKPSPIQPNQFLAIATLGARNAMLRIEGVWLRFELIQVAANGIRHHNRFAHKELQRMSEFLETYTAVIARALAVMALHEQELGTAGVGDKAAFLEALGLPRKDVAKMLNTSSDSIKVMIGRLKGSKSKGRGKSKKK
jgi:hypothetical protein